MMSFPTGLIAGYAFTLLNAAQGILIFLFHCMYDPNVRQRIKLSVSGNGTSRKNLLSETNSESQLRTEAVLMDRTLTSQSDGHGQSQNPSSTRSEEPLVKRKWNLPRLRLQKPSISSSRKNSNKFGNSKEDSTHVRVPAPVPPTNQKIQNNPKNEARNPAFLSPQSPSSSRHSVSSVGTFYSVSELDSDFDVGKIS